MNCTEKELIKCELISVDFDTEVAEIKIPFNIVKKGFCCGHLLIDFSNVQPEEKEPK